VILTAAQGANLTLPPDLTGRPGQLGGGNEEPACALSEGRCRATAIEYGLIAAGISVAIIAVVSGLGSKLNGKFDYISTQLK
jgi:pilus assembly protein Flp/PilA